MRLRTLTLAAGLTAAFCATAITPAHAGVLDLTCTPPSSVVVTYDPPLTLTPAPHLATDNALYGPCVSLSQPGITSGQSTVQVNVPSLSCLSLLTPTPVTFSIAWNNGTSSTITGTAVGAIAAAAFVVTTTGVVTSGVFAGDTVVRTVAAPAQEILACTLGLDDVPSLYWTMALEITSL